MSFNLGNFSIDEVLLGVAQDSNDGILYTLDQLTNASMEVSAESTEFTDKKGNVWRRVYTSKSGTFNSSAAMLHPAILAAGSGSPIQRATSVKSIKMPKIAIVNAGASIDISDAVEASDIKVIGIFGNGANDDPIADVTTLISGNTLTVPSVTGGPVRYAVVYETAETDGLKIVNDAYKFPDIVKLTLYCSYAEPCSNELRACYVVIPRFQPDPNQTITLDRETQEIDFNGEMNIDFCATERTLYYIYFPSTGTIEEGNYNPSGDEDPENP